MPRLVPLVHSSNTLLLASGSRHFKRLPLLVTLCYLPFVLVLAGCGGAAQLTIYLPQRLGPEGPNGQRVPVLMPVERDRRGTMSAARQAVLELMAGPAPDERARGFLDTIPLSTRLLGLRVSGDVTTVELVGDEPDYVGSAAIVYSVTDQAGVERVRLLLDGRRCCVYTHRGTPWLGALDRRLFRGWTGEPCGLRTENHCRAR
jgi:hypothetical protein